MLFRQAIEEFLNFVRDEGVGGTLREGKAYESSHSDSSVNVAVWVFAYLLSRRSRARQIFEPAILIDSVQRLREGELGNRTATIEHDDQLTDAINIEVSGA